jgi:hypothetical protein
MRVFRASIALGWLLAVLVTGTGYGHGDQEPWLDAAVTSVHPGEQFTLVGGELGSGATVRLGVLVGDRSRSLGTVVADKDGHFVTEVTAPADVEQLYVEVRAHSEAGADASLWLLVGDPSLLVPTPAPIEGPSGLADPSVIVLVIVGGGTLMAVAWLILRATKPGRVSHQRRPPARD